MKIKIGNYEVNGEFTGKENAKEIFLSHFPDVTPDLLEKELNKKFKDADKSNNVSAKNTDGNGSNAKTGKRGTGEK